MNMTWLILIALSPGILYGVALVITGLASKYYRRRCPRCGGRGLLSLGLIKATVLIDGRRAPDYWIDYECESCGAGLRMHHGAWEDRPCPKAP